MTLQRPLIICGLLLIPFYELIFRLFPYVQVLAPDTRVTKELVAMVFALAIGLSAVFTGLKPFKNKFLLVLVVYLMFSYFMSPFIPLQIDGINSANYWFWKPMVQVLCFLLMVVAVTNIEIDDKILLLAVRCGAVMSFYAILQWLGFDQFWGARQGDQFIWVTQPNVAGSLGNSTVMASFIVMLVPLAIYLKRFWLAALMTIAVLITKSDMAVFALLFILAVLVMRAYPIFILYFSAFIVIVGIACGSLFVHNKNFHDYIVNKTNGRSAVWGQTLNDFRNGPVDGVKSDYSFTGAGLGSFPHLFTARHNSIFQQAHNEPLEFLYSCGLVGFCLAFLAVCSMLVSGIKRATERTFFLSVSFGAILVCSLGLFVFQLGAHQFYTALIVGLLHQENGG